MYYNLLKCFLTGLVIILCISCVNDHGIEPKPFVVEKTGFGGTVRFLGSWPDSIQRTHIVVFKDPLLVSSDFNIFNLKYVSWEIPHGTQIFNYTSIDSSFVPGDSTFAPGEYAYVAVAQQTTDNLSLSRKDWFVAGVYYEFGDTSQPGTMVIEEDKYTDNVNITCDFDNPPPQPPGGN
jgi:hypothetical protein